MTMQDAQAEYSAFMSDDSCITELESGLSDIARNIEECGAMLDCAIHRADKDEISFWRRMLQKAKVQRRELLAT